MYGLDGRNFGCIGYIVRVVTCVHNTFYIANAFGKRIILVILKTEIMLFVGVGYTSLGEWIVPVRGIEL